MFKALVLVRNLESSAQRLDLDEFTLSRVGTSSRELRQLFYLPEISPDNWVFEKTYAAPPPGVPGSAVGGIPSDVEETLLLLRLNRVGEVSFSRLVVLLPSGVREYPSPSAAMNELNSNAFPRFAIDPMERESWMTFARSIRRSSSWLSAWFAVARRFFLVGSAKKFNPDGYDVDRIVDYATALEAALVPERGRSTIRVSQRAAKLVAPDEPAEAEAVANLIWKAYDTRSQIVHGRALDETARRWLFESSAEIERRVREVLVNALHKLPPGEQDRRAALAALFDPTEDD